MMISSVRLNNASPAFKVNFASRSDEAGDHNLVTNLLSYGAIDLPRNEFTELRRRAKRIDPNIVVIGVPYRAFRAVHGEKPRFMVGVSCKENGKLKRPKLFQEIYAAANASFKPKYDKTEVPGNHLTHTFGSEEERLAWTYRQLLPHCSIQSLRKNIHPGGSPEPKNAITV